MCDQPDAKPQGYQASGNVCRPVHQVEASAGYPVFLNKFDGQAPHCT